MKNIKEMCLIIVFLFSLTSCEIFDAAVNSAVDQTQTEKEAIEQTQSRKETVKSKPTRTTSSSTQSLPFTGPSRKETSSPTIDSCISAKSVSLNRKGESIEVCGMVTYVGEETCPNCPNGFYSYLILDENFYILSYDWEFFPEWLGECIMVKDLIEPFGSKPAFVFGSKEGYDGSKCEYLPDGTLTCNEGDYFQPYSGCK